MRLRRVPLDALTIVDEKSFRHVALYDELKQVVRRDGLEFLVAEPSEPGEHGASWDRVLFLNLTYWSAAEPSDVLADDHIPADVVMHAAWHHLARRALAGPAGAGESVGTNERRPALSADALFLGEAIASAFDVYLVGRLLGHAPESEFLETQAPAMAEAAEAAGTSAEAFEELLDEVAREPERAFEDLRALLFDACTTLVGAADAKDAARRFEALDRRRFAPLLHHYELSNWILYARACVRDAGAPDERVRAVDAALRAAPDSLAWLEASWLRG